MRFDKCIKSESLADSQVFRNCARIEQCAYQKHTIRSHRLCLIYLVFIYHKILTQHRNSHVSPDIAEYLIRSQEPFGFCQARNTVCACIFIFGSDLHIVKYGIYQPLRR